MTNTGVLQQERDRQQFWLDLGLPDPVRVLSEERMTRRLYGPPDWRSPDREALDAFFTDHADQRPNQW